MGQLRFLYRFILLPSFVGLACLSCVSVPSQSKFLGGTDVAPSNLVTSKNKLELDSTLPEQATASNKHNKAAAARSQSLGISAAAYREGINLASSAYNLSQSAVSPDDWSLISARWQRAANHLKKVSIEDKNYAAAQKRIPEYVRNAEHATAQLQALQKSANTPLPPRPLPLAPLELATQKENTVKSRPAPVRVAASTTPPNTALQQRPSAVRVPTPVQTQQRTVPIAEPAISRVQVPIVRRMHGTPVVRVVFNGEQSYEMILDTGASRTLITRPMADRLGIVATGKMTAATASANDVTFELGQMRSMSLGTVTLSNAQVSIGDAVSIGLLGNDFLKGYDVTIRESSVELVESR